MRFNVEISEGALKSLQSLNKDISNFLFEVIEKIIALNTKNFGNYLQFALKGQRIAKAAQYKIIYIIDDEKKLVTVTAVGITKNVYPSDY